MKKFFSVIAWTLALNFLAAVGGIVWLYKSGKLDREKVHQIKELVFAPATQPVEEQPEPRDPTTQPTLKLEEMLAKVSGRSASEQVEFMQKTFEAERMILDRRLEDLRNQRRTLEEAKRQADKEREKLVADQKKLAAAQQEQAKLVSDKGFQDTLGLYTTMPPRQVKTIFMTMSDETMVQYLRAMEPRTASKIMKEFKTADEEARIAKVMEKMREPQAASNP